MSVVVIDPGHGGTKKIGGSSPNNAKSASNVLEKDINLDIARRVRQSLQQGLGYERAKQLDKDVKVALTRDLDINIGLSARAEVAQQNKASIYLSIHCNHFDGIARGTECWVDRKYMQPKIVPQAGDYITLPGPGSSSSGVRNINIDADIEFAKRIVDATLAAFKEFDNQARLRSEAYTRATHGESFKPPPGIKMKGFNALRDAKLGTQQSDCRAALLEIEFIDHPKVDELLNGAKAIEVRNKIANNISISIVEAL